LALNAIVRGSGSLRGMSNAGPGEGFKGAGTGDRTKL